MLARKKKSVQLIVEDAFTSYIILQLIIQVFMEGQALNIQHIIQALTVIHAQGTSASDIKAANSFLNQCEDNPYFSTMLLSIYSESHDYQLQMSSLILLTNVVKRNWNPKRSANVKGLIKPQIKEQLRNRILQAYLLHDMRHYKHFNALISYLTRIDFPVQYIALHQFITNSLLQLIEMVKTDLETVLKSNRVLIVLSTCKVILKQYNHKKIAHNQNTFLQYITSIIQISVNLSQQLYQHIKTNFKAQNADELVSLFESLRKIDKVILYGLGSMPSLYQYKPQIRSIVKKYIVRVDQFNNLFDQLLNQALQNLSQQIQKYFIGIIQELARLQNYFPFMFAYFLREYLYLILKMFVNNVPKPKYYQSSKLLSVIVTANIKPLTSFAYYMTNQEFRNSVYSRQRSDFDNTEIQKHCSNVFRQVYTPSSVSQLIQTIICQVMTAPHVLKDHKDFIDQLVLEDVDIAIVEQPTECSVYDNCISFLKQILKCFKEETHSFVVEMIKKMHQLNFNADRFSRQIFANILELILILPHVYTQAMLPIQQVCTFIQAVYEANMFSYLSRLIRKYHTHLSSQTIRVCFEILAKVVATPISNLITPEIIYQSALGLKTIMNGMENDNFPVQLLGSCISNIVSLVSLKEFVACPTLMWPLINLLMRLLKSLYDIKRQHVGQAASIIVMGLSPLISSEKNQELLVSALAELIATLFYCCFRGIKQEYHVRGRQFTPSEKFKRINKVSFVVFEAAIMFLKCNIHNKSLENNYTIYRFWLSLVRSYPTIYQQQLYDFQLDSTNSKLVQLFNKQSKELMEDEPVIFLEVLQEYFITELIDISPNDLLGIISRSISQEEAQEKRIRVVMASTSLYYSYSLLRAPVLDIVGIIFKQLIGLQNKISPQNNSLRTQIFLMLSQLILNSNGAQIYNLFTNCFAGDVGSWFVPYLWNMHFVTNKFAFKLNAAVLLKCMADIGSQNFAQLLTTQHNQQYAIDELLKIITIELQGINIEFMANSYHNITKALLPNEIVPEFEVPTYRKTKLHLSDPVLINVAQMNLIPEFRARFGDVLRAMDWSSADLEQRVGQAFALKLCDYLGWEKKIA